MENDKKLYMYVYRMILNDIYNAKYTYKSKLPPLPELCKQYGVGRNTMRSALLELSKDGYIVVKKGVQATLLYNINDPQDFMKYKQELVNRKNMLKDAYETIELILPDIIAKCLTQATSEQMAALSDKVNSISLEYFENGNDVIEFLYSIYLDGLSIIGNPLLNDIFMTIMNSVNPSAINAKADYQRLQKAIKMLKTMMKTILKFSKKNDFIVKKAISKMCRSSSERGMEYIEELCQGIEVSEEKEFVWMSHRDLDYLYLQVIGCVLRKIYYREYQKGTKLPSIQKISKEYDVSEKTTRKALKVLREFHVIETVNGVGSIVIINNIQNNSQVIYNKEIMPFVEQYFYSIQLLSLIVECIAPQILKNAPKEDLLEIKQTIKTNEVFSLEPLVEYIFLKSNKCLYVIYEELSKAMVWCLFINQFVDSSHYDFLEIRRNVYKALEIQDVSTICDSIKEVFLASFEIKNKIVDKNGMSI